MSRESVNARADSERNGDRTTRDKSRDSSERNVNDKEVEKLVYAPRNSDTTVELFSDSLKCLMTGRYLNDELIQVYIAYLMNEKCSSSTLRASHVFDSYFHKTIRETFSPERPRKGGQRLDQREMDLEQDEEQDLPINKAKWLQLSKWFNGTDIFGKDFLIFPVCHDDHWFAIIVCYPKEVRYHDEEPASSRSGSDSRRYTPGIMYLDSLGMKNSLVTKDIRSFLDFEWRTRLTKVKDFYYHNLKEYKPILPKQTNSYDCGIFMLAYLKAFLNDPEKFYKLVRRDDTARAANPEDQTYQDQLASMINMELSACSRESIKSTIYKKCRVEKSRNK